jgi:SAM-dependent methyltransferase
MEFEEYINKLRREEEEKASFLELDKDKELQYVIFHRYRYDRIIGSIPDCARPIKILDIGTTPFTFFIKELFPHYEVSTIDLTNLMETRCKTHGIQFKICDLDNQVVPFENEYFDVVIFTEVLEHIFSPPTVVLKEVRRIMSSGGKLILSVPNIATLVNRVKFMFGITPLPNPADQLKKDWVHGHGHIHEYTMNEITSILTACNFTISKKEFLQPSSVGPYSAVCSLVPSFRPTIYIECFKPDPRALKGVKID